MHEPCSPEYTLEFIIVGTNRECAAVLQGGRPLPPKATAPMEVRLGGRIIDDILPHSAKV